MNKDDDAIVRFAASNDGGRTFSKPIEIDRGDLLGRVATAIFDDDSAVVTWLDLVDEEHARLRIRRIAKGGRAGPAMTIDGLPATRGSGFPTVASNGKAVLVAWTDVNRRTIKTVLVRRDT